MTKKTDPSIPETPEIGDAIGMSDLVDFLFDLDEDAFSGGDHAVFGKLIRTVKLQCTAGGHFKYWHGTLYEKGHVRKWGKIGAWVQSKEFPAESVWQAERDFEEIVDKKLYKSNPRYQYASEKEAEDHIKE